MLKSKSLIAMAVAAAFALPLAAGAAGTDRPPTSPGTSAGKTGSSTAGNGGSMSSMKQLDKNNDGYVSKAEAKKSSDINKRFNELDKNNDGKLSSTELNAAQATGAGGSTTRAPGTPSTAGSPAGKGSSAQGSATEGPRKGN